MQASYGNCSKNYINCRKHPERTTSAVKRVNEDFRVYRTSITKEVKDLSKQVEEAEKSPSVKQGTLKRLKKELTDSQNRSIAVLGEASFNEWVENKKQEIMQLSSEKKSIRTQQRELNEIIEDRENIISSIKTNVEKEIALTRAKENPLEGFKLAVTKLLIKDGYAFNESESSWGDSRGTEDYEGTRHLRDSCEPAIIRDYQEDYTWSTYDSINSETEHGVSAHISCKCGEVYNKKFILENQGFASILERLMNA